MAAKVKGVLSNDFFAVDCQRTLEREVQICGIYDGALLADILCFSNAEDLAQWRQCEAAEGRLDLLEKSLSARLGSLLQEAEPALSSAKRQVELAIFLVRFRDLMAETGGVA